MAKSTAVLSTRNAPLASEFGISYATKLFGADALAGLPRYTRGPKTGQIKGYLIWIKAEIGGWDRGYGVCRPGLVRAWIGAGPFSPQGDALIGMFHGRMQSLCASRDMLGDEAQARSAAQRERDHAEMMQIAQRREG